MPMSIEVLATKLDQYMVRSEESRQVICEKQDRILEQLHAMNGRQRIDHDEIVRLDGYSKALNTRITENKQAIMQSMNIRTGLNAAATALGTVVAFFASKFSP